MDKITTKILESILIKGETKEVLKKFTPFSRSYNFVKIMLDIREGGFTESVEQQISKFLEKGEQGQNSDKILHVK